MSKGQSCFQQQDEPCVLPTVAIELYQGTGWQQQLK